MDGRAGAPLALELIVAAERAEVFAGFYPTAMSEEDEEAAAEDAEVEGEDSFEKQYQDALMLFCRGKHKDAFELWTLQVENPLTLPSTQQKIAFSLGQCYCTGTGTKKDALKALEFLKLAARLGNVDAEIALGRCLRYDLCEDENATSFAASAVRHFTAAAENGSAEGRYELGLCYLQVWIWSRS